MSGRADDVRVGSWPHSHGHVVPGKPDHGDRTRHQAGKAQGGGPGDPVPLAQGQEDRGRAWAKETFGSEEMTASRRAVNQNLEVVTLTQTPQGPVCGIYIEGRDPVEANRTLAASTEPFDVAIKDELRVLFPPFVDFSQPVTGVTEIFDTHALLSQP